jgi:hypothetical protein
MKAEKAIRSRALVYLPLVMHLAPTLAIGFGLVIPGSCIAGLNELTIGFAAANLGFVLSYMGGVRLARRARSIDA